MISIRAAISGFVVITLCLPGALSARRQGSSSPATLLAELETLEREGSIDELRYRTRAAAELETRDPAILKFAARISDTFGDRAAETYERWTDALLQSDASMSARTRALERGVIVALRDGDQERARRMSSKLGGDSPFARLSAGKSVAPKFVLEIIGGTAPLAQIAEMDPTVPPSRFLSEYARAILRQKISGPIALKVLQNRLKDYLDVLQMLGAYGRPGTEDTEILLDVTSPAEVDRTEKVLSVFGWQVRRLPDRVLLELGIGAENSARQEFVSALGIDEADMKLTLEKGKPFVVQLHRERVPMLVDPSFWGKLARGAPGRGLLEDMIYNPRVAGLYIALSNMTEETQQAILSVIPTEELLDRTKQLSFYGAGISIQAGRLILPGGAEATSAWAKLVEADPSQIRTFVRNLMRKDGGKLAAYYYALAVLPVQNQRFFTRTPSRLSRFYRVFPYSDEQSVGEGIYERKEDPFAQLAREIPLDPNGSVRFPGSDRVWMIAGHGSESVNDLPKLLQRASRITSPDAEDDILLEMLDRESENAMHRQFRLIQNFLAVVGIDAHRQQPMDETMALALAQNYTRYASVYPYFTEFTELTGSQTISFFQAAKRLESLEGGQLRTGIGELHALLKLVSLLHERKAIPGAKAAQLFATICNNLARIKTADDLGAASFDSVENIIRALDASEKDADEQLLLAFGGNEGAKEFRTHGTFHSVNPGAVNRRRMQAVLRLQSIVPLQTLLHAYRGALQAAEGNNDALAVIEKSLPGIVEIIPAEKESLPRAFGESVLIGRPDQLANRVRALKKQLESQKSAPKNVARAASDVVSELNPFLKTTLTGWIYAYYFSPADLAVASNRYFVRSHEFSDSVTKDYWPTTYLHSTDTGSRLTGGFAQIGLAIGDVAASAVDSTPSVAIYHPATMQLAAARSVPWSVMQQGSIHLAALRVRVGREFIVQAAFSDGLRAELENAAVGILGPARRREMLESVLNRDTAHAMSLLTSSDLFFLADAFIQSSAQNENSAPLLSAYSDELRRVPLEQVQYFGGIHTETAGCTHVHLMNAPPYEEFADRQTIAPIAERMSDILLEVVESADRAGLPIEAVGLLTEHVARQFFSDTRNTPRQDWLSSAQALSRLDMSAFVDALEKR